MHISATSSTPNSRYARSVAAGTPSRADGDGAARSDGGRSGEGSDAAIVGSGETALPVGSAPGVADEVEDE